MVTVCTALFSGGKTTTAKSKKKNLRFKLMRQTISTENLELLDKTKSITFKNLQ